MATGRGGWELCTGEALVRSGPEAQAHEQTEAEWEDYEHFPSPTPYRHTDSSQVK